MPENPLSCLVGESLSTVSLVHDYVEFHFDGPVLRSLTNPVARSGELEWRFPEPGSRDGLCQLIGSLVEAVVLEEDAGITIVFLAGERLTIPFGVASVAGGESAHFVPARASRLRCGEGNAQGHVERHIGGMLVLVPQMCEGTDTMKARETDETFGERLAEARQRRGLTQAELGRAVGASQRVIAYLRGRRRPATGRAPRRLGPHPQGAQRRAPRPHALPRTNPHRRQRVSSSGFGKSKSFRPRISARCSSSWAHKRRLGVAAPWPSASSHLELSHL